MDWKQIEQKVDTLTKDTGLGDNTPGPRLTGKVFKKMDTPPKPVSNHPEKAKDTPEKKPKKRLFVIVTEDFTGFGWAKKLLEEGERVVIAHRMGEDEKDPDKFKMVGKNWLPTIELDQALKDFISPNTYWIFDTNHLSEVADDLRAKGQKVFGTGKLNAKMEHDRAYGVKIAKDAGLDSPETTEFKSVEEGLAFLDANPDNAYVFKPDAAEFNRLTFVPFREKSKDANRELYHYLKHVPFDGTYILQERKAGVEVNAELWLFEGKPFLGTVTLENKRSRNRDLGEMAGCASDIMFTVPIDSELIKRTVGLMVPFYAKEKYTGFIDVNVIVGDNHVWFLEVCDRFGYSAHPNLFINLALDGFGSIMADWMDGKVEDIPAKFRKGFGASITVMVEHPREGLPLHVNEDYLNHFFPYDGYKEGDDLLLTGYSGEVGVFCDFDYTAEGAADNCLQKLFYNEAVSFPDMAFRTDLGQHNYANAPTKRYESLRRMGLICC